MNSDVDLALAAADAGVAVLRKLYRQPLARYDKSPTDFATEADLAAEDAIRAVIRSARPDDAFVGEERAASAGSASGRRWLVDPLCGTLNYAAGTPLAAVNVALATESGVAAAVSAGPIADEAFWTDGRAAWLRTADEDVPLTPSARSGLVDVNCDGTDEFVGPQLLADPDFRARFGPRVLSSTLAVAWVAAGRRTAYVTDGQLAGSVHFTAGIALCQAAGCVVTDLAGNAVHSGPGLIAAVDADTHRRLVELVGRYR